MQVMRKSIHLVVSYPHYPQVPDIRRTCDITIPLLPEPCEITCF